MTTPLKKALRDHVGRRGLQGHQLERLEQLLRARASPRRVLPMGWHWVGAAGLFVFAFVLGLMLPWPETASDMPLRIAEEVVGNHLKLKPLEVQGRDLAKLGEYFSELDFVLRDSGELAVAGLDLLGGRYCSLQGNSAAQLRLRDAQGRLHTLYQVPYDRAAFSDLPRVEEGEKPQQVYASGVGVRIWVEKGILFALTED